MTQVKLSDLKDRVSDIARKSAVAGSVKDILLESDRDNDGDEFLRVIVEVKRLDDMDYENLAALASAIEHAVSAVDDRFPSVRFADAA